jgi:CDP-glycerol glycerophosphotransferase (TagB/SpsB family)
VWIISDRTSAAGDNGEALFNYLVRNSNARRTYDIYFAIDKKAKDYQRLKSIGRVVNRFGFRYKLLFLCADKIISSHAEDNIYNAFEDRYTNFVDLYKFDFVFLQHGITKDDLSSWINKYAKNVKLFITATPMEYRSITSGKYGYDTNEVALTGFPRYDLLEDNKDKKMIIMPTWRTNLVPPLNQKTGTRDYSKDFKKSDFFTFYNQLINDDNLQEVLSRLGYTGEFYLHPGLSAQIDDFTSSEYIKVMPFPHSYKQAFSTGSLLLTDYSSVAFDFAYMKKPVIYTQFDEKDFFEGQMYSKGYFSYEKDGLGPVEGGYTETIEAVVKLLEHNANMEKKYQKRVDSFFKYTDRKNSERVYKAIHKLGVYRAR